MRCAIAGCKDFDTYKVYFKATGKMVRYCTKHGELYIKLQAIHPELYQVYSTSELTRHMNTLKKRIRSLIISEILSKKKVKPNAPTTSDL